MLKTVLLLKLFLETDAFFYSIYLILFYIINMYNF